MAHNSISDTLGFSNRKADVERELDNAVADSFPASDPVSLAQPHDPAELGQSRGLSAASMWILGGGLLAVLAIIAMRR